MNENNGLSRIVEILMISLPGTQPRFGPLENSAAMFLL